jgi:hypothetical protein
MLIDVRHGLYSRVAVHFRWGVSLGRWKKLNNVTFLFIICLGL